MPRGFMLYVSAAAVGLLGFGQPVPAEATDTSQTSAMTTAVPDTAAATAASAASDAAASIASSIGSSSSTSISSSASSISVTVTPSSSSSSSSSSSQTTSSPSYTASSSSTTVFYDTETCQSKTINYITHTLPQQCLRTSWSSANATATTTETAGRQAEAAPSETAATATEAAPEGEAKAAEKEKSKEDENQEEDLATDSFMSFEEWKVLQLKKAGQDPAEMQARRRQQQQQQYHHAGQHAHGAGGDINIDSIGDDGEIALDFDVLNEKVSEMAGSASSHTPSQYHDGSGGGGYRQDGSASDGSNGASGGGGSGAHDEAVVYADGATQYYRSKDAGKTGKERFSFASFDAGATVLKANKGVKNAKAILVENKDSYMLLECRTHDKHVIVELSDDILVDTVVLANFEFFSSMVRRFRVSVSDRYPVKADRWRTLGEYEARNSRDIQPFLIEHPQIWAKYIRIDFLTHYGSEYYCPISLLRVHGTRMLDSWKDSENGRDGEEDEELENQQQYEQQQQQQQQYEQQQIEQDQQRQEEERAQAEAAAAAEAADKATKVAADANACDPAGYTPWNPIAAYLRLFIADAVCLPTSAPTSYASDSNAKAGGSPDSEASQQNQGSVPAAEKAGNRGKPSQAAESAPTTSAQPADNASTPAHTQSGAKDTPASDSPSSSSTSYNASSSSDASQPSQASDSASSPSATAAKVQEQEASAAAAAAAAAVKQKSGSAGNQQTPPPTTVQTPHAKNRASSGGAAGGAGGGSSQSGSGSSGSTGGSGSNPGATPQNSGSSTSGGNNNNNNNNNNVPPGGAPSPPPPPIVQESFFKSITKRLQLLESNTSLSLQYIEDQSRFLQEALRKMERKQISRVDSFLDTLNNTVLSELRNMRQQYDQIWQSTVIALETQREQNQRETVALSDRLNVLADEVVFQKRMAILQSVLLLCCLALVIFSRGLFGGSASVPLDVNAATAAAMAAAAGYMPTAGSAMSPSPSSPPSASSSVGLRSNLRSLRNNLRNPYAAYSVYASGYPLSAYSAGSPPPPNSSNLRAQTKPVNMPVNGSATSIPAPINKNKVLPLTPTTPTSPTSPGSPVSPEPMPSNESQDSLLSVDEQESQAMQQEKGPGLGPVLVEPKPLTPPASLRLSDIEEAADQLEEEEEEEDSSEDRDDETILSEATTVHPDRISGDDNTSLFTPTAATPTKVDVTENDLLSSSASFPEASHDLPLSRKRLPSLPEHNSD